MGVLRQAEIGCWFLFDCLKKDSLKTMVRHAGSAKQTISSVEGSLSTFAPESNSCAERETEVITQASKMRSLRSLDLVLLSLINWNNLSDLTCLVTF